MISCSAKRLKEKISSPVRILAPDHFRLLDLVEIPIHGGWSSDSDQQSQSHDQCHDQSNLVCLHRANPPQKSVFSVCIKTRSPLSQWLTIHTDCPTEPIACGNSSPAIQLPEILSFFATRWRQAGRGQRLLIFDKFQINQFCRDTSGRLICFQYFG